MLDDKIDFWKNQVVNEDLIREGICKGSRVAFQEVKNWIERNF